MYEVLLVIAGIILGYISAVVIKHEEPVGTIRIDSSDPDDGPYLFLELETSVAELKKQPSVRVKIDTKSYISQI